MLWGRMLRVVIRLAGRHLLMPWRSPLLRWRMETYGVTDERGRLLHADEITPIRFLQFTCCHRVALLQFLGWAARL